MTELVEQGSPKCGLSFETLHPFSVELIVQVLPNAVYLSCVVCALLHSSRVYPVHTRRIKAADSLVIKNKCRPFFPFSITNLSKINAISFNVLNCYNFVHNFYISDFSFNIFLQVSRLRAWEQLIERYLCPLIRAPGILKIDYPKWYWVALNFSISNSSLLVWCKRTPYFQEHHEDLSLFPAVNSMVQSIRDSFAEKRRGICKFRSWSGP